jgi:hypothetical protein
MDYKIRELQFVDIFTATKIMRKFNIKPFIKDFNSVKTKDMTEEELDDIIVNEILKLGKDEDEVIDTVQLKTCKVCGEVLTSLWEREDGVCKACQEEEEWN